MRRLGALLVIAATLLVARPADAATGSVTAVTVGAAGDQRAVAWLDAGTLYFRWLDSGTRVALWSDDGSTEYGKGITVTVSPAGAVVGLPVEEVYSDHDSRTGAEFFYVSKAGQVTVIGHPCPDAFDNGGATPGGGGAAWDGTRFLLAAACPSYGATATYSPTEGLANPGGFDTTNFDMPTGVTAAATSSGFTVAWTELGATDLDVVAQRFDDHGQAVGDLASVATGTGDQDQPTLGTAAGRTLAVWVEAGDLYGRVIGATTLGPRRHLVDASGGQNHPSVTAGSSGWQLAWSDLRAGNNDIYARHIASAIPSTPANGALVAGGNGAQAAPTVAALTSGRALVAFVDQGVGKTRELDATGRPTGATQTVTAAPK